MDSESVRSLCLDDITSVMALLCLKLYLTDKMPRVIEGVIR